MEKSYAEKYLDAVKEIERLEEEIKKLKKERGVLLPGHTYILGNATITISEDSKPGEEVIW